MGKVFSAQCSVFSVPGRALALMLGLLCLVSCSSKENLPSDASLLKTFEEQRDRFQKLSLMLREDKSIQVLNLNMTVPDPLPFGPTRLSQYRQSLAAIGCDRGLNREKDGVFLRAAGVAWSAKGAAKGYYLSSTKPEPLVENLDAFKLTAEQSVAFRQIEGDWYLCSSLRSP